MSLTPAPRASGPAAGRNDDAGDSHPIVTPVTPWKGECDSEAEAAIGRLRRDIHDQIGSCAAAIITQLQAGLVGAGDDGLHEYVEVALQEAQVLIDAVRRLSSAATTSPRRPGRPPLREALTEMVDRMNRTLAGRPLISLRVRGEIERLPHEVAVASFWIAREALTNVFRHADAEGAWVSLLVGEDAVELSIIDNGTSSEIPSTGEGLTNMFGRARELGGNCTALPVSGGGFRVAAHLPTYQPTLEPASQDGDAG